MIHFLLTKFNVTLPDQEPPSEEWLKHRIEVFEEFTAPSVEAQACQDFYWAVFVDAPDWSPVAMWCIRNFERWEKFNPMRVASDETYGLPWLQETAQFWLEEKKEEGKSVDWLITTRLDSDDAIEPFFVEKIQEQFREETEFLSFPSGYQHYDGKRHKVILRSNAFLSYVEPAEDPKTVYHVNHTVASESAPVRDILSEPAWTQVCHKFSSNKPIGG